MSFKLLRFLPFIFLCSASAVANNEISYSSDNTTDTKPADFVYEWADQGDGTLRMDLPQLEKDTHLNIEITPSEAAPIDLKIKKKENNMKLIYSVIPKVGPPIMGRRISKVHEATKIQLDSKHYDIYLEAKTTTAPQKLQLQSTLGANDGTIQFVPKTVNLDEGRGQLQPLQIGPKIIEFRNIAGFSGKKVGHDIKHWSLLGDLKKDNINFQGHRDEKMTVSFSDEITPQGVGFTLDPYTVRTDITISFDADVTDGTCFAVLYVQDGLRQNAVDLTTTNQGSFKALRLENEEVQTYSFDVTLEAEKTYKLLLLKDESPLATTLVLENLSVTTN